MSITAGITATKATLDVAKLLMDRLNAPEVDVHDIRLKVQEMLIHTVNAQIALGDANNGLHIAAEENRELKRKIQKLRDSKATTEGLIFADEVYLRWKSEGVLDGPFCPACWDIDTKLVRLKLARTNPSEGCPDGKPCRRYDCVVHKISYYIPASKFNTVGV
jgi:hypothetical protein